MDRILTGQEEKWATQAEGTGEQRPRGKRCSDVHLDGEAEPPLGQARGIETIRRLKGGFVKIWN